MDSPHCSVLQITDPHVLNGLPGPLAFLIQFRKWEVMAGDQRWEEPEYLLPLFLLCHICSSHVPLLCATIPGRQSLAHLYSSYRGLVTAPPPLIPSGVS